MRIVNEFGNLFSSIGCIEQNNENIDVNKFKNTSM